MVALNDFDHYLAALDDHDTIGMAELGADVVNDLLGAGRRRAGRTSRPVTDGAGLDERDVEAVELLVEHFGGHHPVVKDDNTIEVTRPGKKAGTSASVGGVSPGMVKVWSSDWAPFEGGGLYSIDRLEELAGLHGEPKIKIPPAPEWELPAGFRLWRPGDGDRVDPVLPPSVFIDPIGDFLELLHGQTEAHPAAVGIQVIAYLGTLIGRRSRLVVGWSIVHFANLFVIVLGPTSTARKGVSDSVVNPFITMAQPDFLSEFTIGGLGSGEALVDALDEGSKSRVVVAPEFSNVLKIAARPDNTLSDQFRIAYDAGARPLSTRTRSRGTVEVFDHHVSIVGATTPAELALLITETDSLNGWLNRFLPIWSRSTVKLPFGGHVEAAHIAEIAAPVAKRLADIDGRVYRLRSSPAVEKLWIDYYDRAREGQGSTEVVRRFTLRHVAHCARIAHILAAIDGATEIGTIHLDAAIGWCDYSLATVERAFGPDLVTGSAAKLLTAIRDAGDSGLTGTEQRDATGRNQRAGLLEDLRNDLEQRRLIFTFTEPSGGRPTIRSVAIWPEGPS